MAEQVWTTGRLTAVYQPAGTHAGGSARWRRAPFDLLTWASTSGGAPETYVSTHVGFDDGFPAVIDDSDAVGTGHEFGFYDFEAVIVEPHQGNGLDDSWKSLHSLGYL